jgi:hypothetical protein
VCVGFKSTPNGGNSDGNQEQGHQEKGHQEQSHQEEEEVIFSRFLFLQKP